MQRNPGFPVANCSLQMPDSLSLSKLTCEDTAVHHQMRQQLINFGHAQWGFNNWSWTVTKQELDFVDMSNEKYIAGVVAYVSISIKNIDIRRENIGYATSLGNNKGYAIFISRKMAVTNALRETLLSFGGTVASELTELLEGNVITEPLPENNQNLANINLANSNHANANPSLANTNLPSKLVKPLLEGPPLIKPSLDGPPLVKNVRKDTVDTAPANIPPAPVKNAPIAKTLSMPANAPRLPTPRSVPAPQPVLQPALHARPNSNVSFVLQPVMGTVVPPSHGMVYGPPRYPTPQLPSVYPNYYECHPWHYYEPHSNVNLNFNIPPKNLVVNSRAGSVECKNACREGEALQYATQQNRGCWIKPTIFYDGFWTEQKVKKWVAEQVEKQFPDENKVPSPGKPDKQ